MKPKGCTISFDCTVEIQRYNSNKCLHSVFLIQNTGQLITIAQKKDFFQTMLRRVDVYLFLHSCVDVQIIDICKCCCAPLMCAIVDAHIADKRYC